MYIHSVEVRGNLATFKLTDDPESGSPTLARRGCVRSICFPAHYFVMELPGGDTRRSNVMPVLMATPCDQLRAQLGVDDADLLDVESSNQPYWVWAYMFVGTNTVSFIPGDEMEPSKRVHVFGEDEEGGDDGDTQIVRAFLDGNDGARLDVFGNPYVFLHWALGAYDWLAADKKNRTQVLHTMAADLDMGMHTSGDVDRLHSLLQHQGELVLREISSQQGFDELAKRGMIVNLWGAPGNGKRMGWITDRMAQLLIPGGS